MDAVASACGVLLDGCGVLLDDSSGRVYAAVSGGLDSTVLLHALAGQARERNVLQRICAVHVDHGLQPSSADWARRCEALARSLGVEFRLDVVDLDPGTNVEARARSARYRLLQAHLGPGDVLALAHHADDQAESVLLHILQGRGLYGMPESRPLGAGRLVRPLLGLPRSDLAAYAGAHGLEWVEDPSNQDLSLDRNYLRREVLPGLSRRFPELRKRLERLAAHHQATTRALEEVLELQRNPLPLSVLDGLPRPVRLAVLRQWLVARNAAAGVRDGALSDFLAQLESANDRQPVLEAGRLRLRRHRRHLYLLAEPPELAPSYGISCPGRLLLPHGVFALEPAPDGASSVVTLDPPLRVTFLGALERNVRIRVGGAGRKPRELMRQAGLPPWEREVLPLLADAQGLALLPGVAVRDPLPGGTTACRWRWEAAASCEPGGDAR